jgi:hypothetical protein
LLILVYQRVYPVLSPFCQVNHHLTRYCKSIFISPNPIQWLITSFQHGDKFGHPPLHQTCCVRVPFITISYLRFIMSPKEKYISFLAPEISLNPISRWLKHTKTHENRMKATCLLVNTVKIPLNHDMCCLNIVNPLKIPWNLHVCWLNPLTPMRIPSYYHICWLNIMKSH